MKSWQNWTDLNSLQKASEKIFLLRSLGTSPGPALQRRSCHFHPLRSAVDKRDSPRNLKTANVRRSLGSEKWWRHMIWYKLFWWLSDLTKTSFCCFSFPRLSPQKLSVSGKILSEPLQRIETSLARTHCELHPSIGWKPEIKGKLHEYCLSKLCWGLDVGLPVWRFFASHASLSSKAFWIFNDFHNEVLYKAFDPAKASW